MQLGHSWLIYTGALYVAITAFIAYRLHWSIAPFLFISLANCIVFPGNAHAILLTAAFFALMPVTENAAQSVKTFLATLCIVSTGVTLSQIGLEPYYRFGISGNASMNGCLIAMTYPAYIVWCMRHLTLLGRTTFMPIPIIAIFMIHASMPIGVLCVAVLVYASYSLARLFVPAVAAMLTLGAAIQGTEFVSDTGRFGIWRNILIAWGKEKSFLLGTGNGSVAQFFRIENVIQGRPRGGFWVHNDWFQILIENGVVGLWAAALLFAFALIKSGRQPWLRASIAAYGACMVFNFPLHLPLHAFTGATFIWLAHAKINHSV